jgi:WD40 repeat protein/serine/threonine protein kinase
MSTGGEGAAIREALKRQDWTAALELLERWCAVHPRHADGWYWRAVCLTRLDRAGDARTCALKALSLAPDDPKIRKLAGEIEQHLERAGPPATELASPTQAPAPATEAAGGPRHSGEESPPATEHAPSGASPPLSQTPATEIAAGPPPTELGGAPPATELGGAQPGSPVPGTELAGAAPPQGSSLPTTIADDVGALWQEGAVIEGRYEVRNVARGGMGEVYFVVDRELDLELAVKTPLPSALATEAGRQRFFREAEAWIGLGLHPNICSAYYVRTISGIPRLFIEFIEGGNLDEWLRAHPEAPFEQRIDLAIQIAYAMHHAHTFFWRDEDGTEHRGVVHRDLKPANVLVGADRDAHVTDFGLVGRGGAADEEATPTAAGVDQVAASEDGVWGTMTLGGIAMGTPPYMPPEQWRGAHAAGETADVYAFGCVLYELLCGRRPLSIDPRFQNARPELQQREWERVHREHAPPSPADLVADLDPDLCQLMVACLAKSPDERPQTFADLSARLREVYERREGRPYPRPEPVVTRLVADALSNRGVSFAALGQMRRAEHAWNEARQSDPHHVEATFNLLLFRWRQGQVSDAEVANILDELGRTHTETWRDEYLAGVLLLVLGRFGDALERLRHAVAASGGGPAVARACSLALHAVAQETQDRGMWQEIAGLLSRHGAALRSDPVVLTAFALACHRLGETTKATRLYSEARRHLGGLPDDLDRGAERVLLGLQRVRSYSAFLGRAQSAVVSRDGRVGVAIAEGNKVHAWDLATGETLRSFKPAGAGLRCLALDPFGSYCLTSSEGELVSVWNLATGLVERRLQAHVGLLNALAVSPDGRLVAGVGSTQNMVVWDLGSRAVARTIPLGSRFATWVAVAADGRSALAGAGGELVLCDLHSGSATRRITAHDAAITAVAITDGARSAVSGDESGVVRLWDLKGKGEPIELRGHGGAIVTVSLSHDGRHCLSASRDGTLRLWDVAAASPLVAIRAGSSLAGASVSADWGAALAAHGQEVLQLCLREIPTFRPVWAVASPTSAREAGDRASGYGEKLASARALFDAGDHRGALAAVDEARSLPGYEREASAVELAAEIASLYPRRELRGGWEERTLLGHGGRVTAVAVSNDGRCLASCGADHRLLVWNREDGEVEQSVSTGDTVELDVALAPDHRRAVTAGLDTMIRVWELDTGAVVTALAGHEAKVYQVALDSGGRRALSASADHSARLWDVESGVCLAILEGHLAEVLCAALSPNDQVAATGAANGSLIVWDLATGASITSMQGPPTAITDVAFSGDGRYLLTVGRDGAVRYWDRASGSCLRVLENQLGLTSLAVSPDDAFVAVGCNDGTARLWSIRARECVRTFSGHSGAIAAVAFTPDGSRLVTAGLDASLRVWFLDWRPDLCPAVDWDERVRPYVEVFLERHGLRAGVSSEPRWNESELHGLLGDLRRRGFGWIRPGGVRRKLEELASGIGRTPELASLPPRHPPRAAAKRATPEQRRRQRQRKRLAWVLVAAAVPAALVVDRLFSRHMLRYNDGEVVSARRAIFETVVPSMPEVAKETTCDPARFRTYLKDFTQYTQDEWDRQVAKHCLEVLGDARAVGPLLDMLRPQRRAVSIGSGTHMTRDRGAQPDVLSVLVRMGDSGNDALVEAMSDADPVVQSTATAALAFRGSEASIRCLVRASESSDPEVRIAVSKVIRHVPGSGRLDLKKAFAVLERLAHDDEQTVRSNVAKALRVLNGTRPRTLAMEMARDSSDEVSAAARESLRLMQ